MWSDREKAIAKELINDETLAFLKKVFVDISPSLSEKLDSNIVALDDAEYGRLMKVKYLSGKENTARLALIRTIALCDKEKPKVAIAPK